MFYIGTMSAPVGFLEKGRLLRGQKKGRPHEESVLERRAQLAATYYWISRK